MPFAMVRGEAVTELPKDLYIPPQALEVFLDAFEGPLDLLLYLIRRQNLDILDIDVANITEQYMRYVELMDAMQFELAAEYLLMAAMLARSKSACSCHELATVKRTRKTRARIWCVDCKSMSGSRRPPRISN